MARGAYFDPDVDPDLLRALESSGYNKHKVELFSGRAARPKNPKSLHPKGRAVDVALYDDKGRKLDNLGEGSPEDIRAYQEYANAVYQWARVNDPQLAHELVWGGYFQGGGWPRDRMHFQRGGVMGGGSWDKGFDPEYAKAAGVEQGGLGEIDAAMKEAGYTPEQRRNAIASIESAGSGDYGAVGPEADPAGHKARGRYQVMDYNIDPWAKQYLGMEGVTTEQFMKDPALQDKLFDAVYGDYVNKYGERGAASKWFTGSEKEPTEGSDVNGKLTGKTYADRYMEAMGAGATHVNHPPNATVGKDDLSGPEATPVADKKDDKGKTWWQKAFGNLGDVSIGGFKQPEWRSTASPQVSMAQAQTTPFVDTASAEARRKLLAEAMARLNSGTLA